MEASKDDVPKQQVLIVDTSAFFAKISQLRRCVQERKAKLATIDLVVFEFVKLMQSEIRDAKKRKKDERTKMLIALRDRFPILLKELDIQILSPAFELKDLGELNTEIASGQDAGDCMIWLKMQKAGHTSILTQNSSDWKKLGAKVESLED